MSCLLELNNISKFYQKNDQRHYVLKDVNTSVQKGETLAIIGASGSGKSSLMHIIGLLDHHYEGEYHFLNQQLSGMNSTACSLFRNQHIGFVFQSFYLLPRFSALENVMLPMQYQSVDGHIAQERALALLDKMELLHLAHHRPDQLSGGQMQRVAIARALVTNPDLILADEPTGALDAKTGKMVLDILVELSHEGKTVVIVTHDHAISTRCDRIVELQNGALQR